MVNSVIRCRNVLTVQSGENIIYSTKQPKKSRNVLTVQSGENIIYSTKQPKKSRNVLTVQSGENIIYSTKQPKKSRNVLTVQSGENIIYSTKQHGLCAVSCSIRWLKGVVEVVFLKMGETFVENDFFKDFGQKWRFRNGAVVFQKIFCQVMAVSTEV